MELTKLREVLDHVLPGTVTELDVWTCLGWDDDYETDYALATSYGIDIRPFIAPVYYQTIGLLTLNRRDNWANVLTGNSKYYGGLNVKQRVLAVVDAAILAERKLASM